MSYSFIQPHCEPSTQNGWQPGINLLSTVAATLTHNNDKFTGGSYGQCPSSHSEHSCPRGWNVHHRAGAHTYIEIEIGERKNIEQRERKCDLCSLYMPETEKHVNVECLWYKDFRHNYRNTYKVLLVYRNSQKDGTITNNMLFSVYSTREADTWKIKTVKFGN